MLLNVWDESCVNSGNCDATQLSLSFKLAQPLSVPSKKTSVSYVYDEVSILGFWLLY